MRQNFSLRTNSLSLEAETIKKDFNPVTSSGTTSARANCPAVTHSAVVIKSLQTTTHDKEVGKSQHHHIKIIKTIFAPQRVVRSQKNYDFDKRNGVACLASPEKNRERPSAAVIPSGVGRHGSFCMLQYYFEQQFYIIYDIFSSSPPQAPEKCSPR